MKKSKRYVANLEQVEKNKTYNTEEAMKLVKAKATTQDKTEDIIKKCL